MDFLPIFSSFLIIDNLPMIDNDELKRYAFEYRLNDQGVVKSNVKGWQSDKIMIPNDEISKLVDSIKEKFPFLIETFGIKKEKELFLNNLWININPSGAFNRPHIHSDCIFSGVYYISVEENSGSIVFQHPVISQQYHYSPESIDKYNYYSASSWSVDPEPGKLLIFPAWIEHYVEPNQSDIDRISIAFNIELER